MTTMAQAIKDYVQSVGKKVTADQIKDAVNAKYPNQWKPGTFQGHLYGCVVNNPKAYIHHPSFEKFLYKHSDGTFEIYSEVRHGPNEWAPTGGENDVAAVDELVETSISLERDIEDHLVNNLDTIEKGLKLVKRQFSTDVGRIDILAEDGNGAPVIIEIKVGEARDSAIGQIARYLGWFAKTEPKPSRGILIAAEFSEGVRYAATAIPNLKLLAYKVHFSFEPATNVEDLGRMSQK
jgi:RecB family endonuclease NucS